MTPQTEELCTTALTVNRDAPWSFDIVILWVLSLGATCKQQMHTHKVHVYSTQEKEKGKSTCTSYMYKALLHVHVFPSA